MSAQRVNVRLALARIADEHGLDLRRPGDVVAARDNLLASLRRQAGKATLVAIAHAASVTPAAQAAQACRIRQQRKVAR